MILTGSEEVARLTQVVLAGGEGYPVPGSFTPEELIRAVRTIHEGGALITPALVPALLALVRHAMTQEAHHGRLADAVRIAASARAPLSVSDRQHRGSVVE